jgi:hypothetical protein
MSKFKVQMKSKTQMKIWGEKLPLPQFIGKLHFVIDSFDIDLIFGF